MTKPYRWCCLMQYRRPLFSFLREIDGAEGSKIEALLSGRVIRGKRHNTNNFLAVLRRLLRDGPMYWPDFLAAAAKFGRRYNVPSRGWNGIDHPSIIGEVRLVGSEIQIITNHQVANAREAEFSRRKYANLSLEHKHFLMALFELNAFIKTRNGSSV